MRLDLIFFNSLLELWFKRKIFNPWQVSEGRTSLPVESQEGYCFNRPGKLIRFDRVEFQP